MLFLQVILFIQPRRGCVGFKAFSILIFDPYGINNMLFSQAILVIQPRGSCVEFKAFLYSYPIPSGSTICCFHKQYFLFNPGAVVGRLKILFTHIRSLRDQ